MYRKVNTAATFFFEAVNKIKCTRNARFPKTELYEDQTGSNREIHPCHGATCQYLPVTSYKSPYLL